MLDAKKVNRFFNIMGYHDILNKVIDDGLTADEFDIQAPINIGNAYQIESWQRVKLAFIDAMIQYLKGIFEESFSMQELDELIRIFTNPTPDCFYRLESTISERVSAFLERDKDGLKTKLEEVMFGIDDREEGCYTIQ